MGPRPQNSVVKTRGPVLYRESHKLHRRNVMTEAACKCGSVVLASDGNNGKGASDGNDAHLDQRVVLFDDFSPPAHRRLGGEHLGIFRRARIQNHRRFLRHLREARRSESMRRRETGDSEALGKVGKCSACEKESSAGGLQGCRAAGLLGCWADGSLASTRSFTTRRRLMFSLRRDET